MAFLEPFTRGAYPESLETSSNWTKSGGTILADCTTGGQLTTASTIGTDALWLCPDQANTDHYSQIDKVNTANNFGFLCVVRATDVSNFIGVRYNSGQVQLYKVVAGAFTGLGTPYTYTWVANDTVKLEVVGNDFVVYVNGTSRITATDSFNNTETRQGIVVRSSTTAAVYDNFEAGAVTTPRITVSPATIVDGGTGYTLETADMLPLTAIKARSKQNNNHVVSLTFTGTSSPYSFSAPNFKANTNETGIAGCPFTTTYDTLELFVDDGTDTAVTDVIFNPASGYDEVKTSNTPSVASDSIAASWQGFYEDITAVSVTGTPTTLTVPTTGMVAGQEATISLLATTPDNANGEYITTIVNSTSITIAANVTAQTDQAGKWLTGYEFEHGQVMFITTDCTINADMEIFHSRTSDFYVQWFDYATSQMKAIPITASTGIGGAGSRKVNLTLGPTL